MQWPSNASFAATAVAISFQGTTEYIMQRQNTSKLHNQQETKGLKPTSILNQSLQPCILLEHCNFLHSSKCSENLLPQLLEKKMYQVESMIKRKPDHISQPTVCNTSIVTSYCMFSIDARSTLLSASFFFPSGPTTNYRRQTIT